MKVEMQENGLTSTDASDNEDDTPKNVKSEREAMLGFEENLENQQSLDRPEEKNVEGRYADGEKDDFKIRIKKEPGLEDEPFVFKIEDGGDPKALAMWIKTEELYC